MAHQLIKELPVTDERILPLVTFVYEYIGWHIPEPEQLATIVKHCRMDINMLHIGIYHSELPVIFNHGAKGEFGEIKTVSAATFNQWFKIYKKSHIRSEWLKENIIMLEAPKLEPKPVDYEALWQRMKADKRQFGNFFDGGGIMYKHMVKRGIIQEDEYERFAEQARSIVNDEILSTRKRKGVSYGGIVSIIQDNMTTQHKVEMIARQMVLGELMDRGI